MRFLCPFVAACVLLVSGNLTVVAQEEPKTIEVKPQFFRVVENVPAIVESSDMTPLAADTENWTSLKISHIVPEGTLVKAGDVIVQFDTEEIERKINESRQTVALAELTLRGSELDHRQQSETLPLDEALAERKMRNAEQDYKYFVDVERPNNEENVRRTVENAQHSLEYVTEEYNQLKRMYEEDELTEESEEIVLKRTERDVENRQFYLEQAQIRAARSLDYDMPRELEEKTDALERSRLEHEKARVMLPLEREKSEIAIEKAAFALDKDRQDLSRLEEDLARMVITAPSDGVVYYGHCQRGKWQGQSGPQRDLPVGSSVVHNKPLVTLVNPQALILRADLTESQIANLHVGMAGLATPVAFPDSPFPVAISALPLIPVAEDKFDCQMSLEDSVENQMPGMKCNVRFLIHENASALTVPETAVFTDDGISHYVFVAGEGEDASPQRRDVETGKTVDKMTEILSGLSAGEKILEQRPEPGSRP